jgi:hypothetical protein
MSALRMENGVEEKRCEKVREASINKLQLRGCPSKLFMWAIQGNSLFLWGKSIPLKKK